MEKKTTLVTVMTTTLFKLKKILWWQWQWPKLSTHLGSSSSRVMVWLSGRLLQRDWWPLFWVLVGQLLSQYLHLNCFCSCFALTWTLRWYWFLHTWVHWAHGKSFTCFLAALSTCILSSSIISSLDSSSLSAPEKFSVY